MDILTDLGLFGAMFGLFTWVVKKLINNQAKRDEELIMLIKEERKTLSNHMSEDIKAIKEQGETNNRIANILGRIEGKLNDRRR